MSNIAFITTKKHIKSYDMLSLFQSVNLNKFDNKLEVYSEDNTSWHIKYQNNFISDYYINSPRKFGTKHPLSGESWINYIFYVFYHEIAVLTNGILSDESDDEKWKPTKDKWNSFKEYHYYMNNYNTSQSFKDQRYQEDLRMVPVELLSILN